MESPSVHETDAAPADRLRRWTPLLAALLLLALTGCAHTRPDLPAYDKEAEVRTLSSAVTLSVRTAAGGIGGNGYLLFQQPDSFRLVMLTPFGTPAIDSYAVGSRLTFLIPSRNMGYSGTVDELPDRAGMEGWRLLRWVLAGDPLRIATGPALLEHNDPLLGKVSVRYDEDGLLLEKLTEAGDRAFYSDYRTADGIPFPGRLTVHDRHGGQATVEFEEPELNRPLADDAFSPKLESLTILPLQEFKGN